MLQDIRELLYSWDKAVFHWINSDWQNSVFDFVMVRPCSDLPNVHLLLYNNCPTTYSFPSNHAVNCFSAAMMVSFFYKKIGIFLFLIAILVAISRVYVGVHYPFDTVGGAIWGILGAIVVLISAN